MERYELDRWGVFLHMRVEWRFVSTMSGGQSVMITGGTRMLKLCADSLDSLDSVRDYTCRISHYITSPIQTVKSGH